jgi:murein DD-endopeptidase MepM/ murein hydrolase activator NlpD
LQGVLCTPDELLSSSTSVTPTAPGVRLEATASPEIFSSIPSLTSTLVPPTSTPCPPDLCAYSDQYFLARPIALPGNDSIDSTYGFGSTQSGRRDPHHGVEFLNGSGTPVLAAADGVVVVTGDDRQPTSPHGVWPITFFGLYSYFYGNLVVIEHQAPQGLLLSFPGLPQPIYTLYGHLSQISVQVGQQVTAGQEIGKVGMTGIAEGSHLHFEVRLGENTYKASRNPELWLKPHTDELGRLMGGIAGRVLNSYNVNLQLSSIVIEHLPEGPDQPNDFQVTLLSYEEKTLIGLAPFEESFGIGDLEAGWYRISYPYLGLQQRLVEVFPGQLTVVTLR